MKIDDTYAELAYEMNKTLVLCYEHLRTVLTDEDIKRLMTYDPEEQLDGV